ncbi:MAG: amidohydrolase [Polyangiaceae bacterium]
MARSTGVPFGRAQVLVNADLRTMTGTRAEALAFAGEELLAVGSRAEAVAAAGPDAEVVDVSGATVLPGFIDAHHHASMVALWGGRLRLVPPRVTSIATLQTALAAAARDADGDWLIATDWDELCLEERRAPTRRELDEAVPDRPLLAMHYSCHRAVVNSRALELAGIARHSADPTGGVISRDHRGEPDGLLIERGMSRVETLARASAVAQDAEGFFARLAEHYRNLVAAGITRIVDATVPADLAALYREADRRGLIPVPTVMMPVSLQGYLEAPWDAMDGPSTGEASGNLTVGALKLVFDGAPACAMCLGIWQMAGTMIGTFARAVSDRSLDALRATMSVAPRLGRKVRTGIRIYAAQEAQDVVNAAVERGFGVAIHAIGNDAVGLALDAYESCGGKLDRAGVPRLEHATFLDSELVTRIAAAGIAVVAQPHFLSLPAMGSAPSIPGLRNSPLRWLLDGGVRVVGSSDFPVAGFHPLDGVRSAVTRRTNRGRALEPDQRITLDEALACYTRSAAEVCGCLDRAGTLEPGKRADFVVLDRALTDIESLDRACVRATVIGGELVHGTLAG